MRHSWFLSGSFAILMVLMAMPAAAQMDPLSLPPPVEPVTEMMQVAGTAVRVRSGPGTYFYEVAQLNEPTQVANLGSERGWVAIKPPASVVALVKKSQISRGDENSGSVDTDVARVYAKERASLSMTRRTWAVIAQLKKDDIVTIAGEEGDFYRIAMPAAAKVYVSSRFLKEVTQPIDPGNGGTPVTSYGTPNIKKFVLDPQDEAFGTVAEALDAEMKKPLMDRSFDSVETDLAAVAAKTKATYLLREIEALKQQIAFQKSLQEGVKKRAAEQAAFKEQLEGMKKKEDAALGKEGVSPIDEMQTFDFEGTLRPITAKMAYKYRLDNDQGRFVCLIDGDEATIKQFIGQKVRVWGDKEFHVELKMNVCTIKRIVASPLGG